MPTLALVTNVVLDGKPEKGAALAKLLSKAVATATKKPEQYVCVSVRHTDAFSFGGSTAPAAHGTLSSIGGLGPANKAISKSLAAVLEAELGGTPHEGGYKKGASSLHSLTHSLASARACSSSGQVLSHVPRYAGGRLGLERQHVLKAWRASTDSPSVHAECYEMLFAVTRALLRLHVLWKISASVESSELFCKIFIIFSRLVISRFTVAFTSTSRCCRDTLAPAEN